MASNAFFQASGNPATGAAGLSALVRAEFTSIQTAFDLVASFQTTGLYVSTFIQQGSYTFTLPNRAGVLALTVDVATAVTAETARATAAEGALNGSIVAEANTRGAGDTSLVGQIASEANTRLAADLLLAPKLNPVITGSLTINDPSTGNFAPLVISSPNNPAGAGVRLTGNGLVTPSKYLRVIGGSFNIVNSGYSVAILTLDDAGNLVTSGTFAALGGIPALTAETNRALAAEATKQANLGFVPVATGWGANVVSIGWNAGHLDAQVDATYLGAIVTTLAPQGFALVSAVASEAATRLAQDQLLAPKVNPVITDTLTINDTSAGNIAPFTISSPNNGSGAGIKLAGNGAVTPSKYLRAINGQFQIINSAYSLSLFSLDDAGNLSVAGTFGAVGGIPALTAETNRAVAAEGGLNTQIAGKQPNLGYTPVQQGTGIGQSGNPVKIGWSVAGLRCTVDSVDQGLIVTTVNGQGYATSAGVAAAYQQISPGNPYVRNIYSANVVSLNWQGGNTLTAQVDSTNLGQVPTQTAPGNFIRTADNATLATVIATGNLSAYGAIYPSATATASGFLLYGNGTSRIIQFSTDGWKLAFDTSTGGLTYYNYLGTSIMALSGAGSMSIPGTMFAANVSDERTKRDIRPYRSGLAEVVGLQPVTYAYNGRGGTTDTGKLRWGVTAQQAALHMPECVYETPEPATDPSHPDPAKIRFPGQLSFDEQPLLYAMVNAFRDVSAELAALKARLTILEAR